MDRPDPFWGYSLLLRTIVFVAVPAFAALQFVRLRRALHVFQLEGYKRSRWLVVSRSGAWARRRAEAKKPLVMTGRAWRVLITATALSVLGVLVPPGIVHVKAGGWPADVAAWALMTALLWFGVPYVLAAADVVLTPVQAAINARYLRSARRKLTRIAPVVVGVTGSFGKTSTKFAIERLVGPPGSALATPSSFNTPLGVCRTINERLQPSHRFFVVEMGAYAEGDVAELCRFVRPQVGVLTAIGPAHLERFGSLDAIRRAKYEIVKGLPPEGTAVMNCDDPEVRSLADSTEGVRVVRYGLDPGGRPDVTATDVEVDPQGMKLTILAGDRRLRVVTRLVGRHAAGHILAAVAVVTSLGRDLEDVRDAIQHLQPVEHRLQVIPGAGGVTVIDDAYNSNPDGAAAALEVLEAMPARRKVVVTPGIIELGPLQAEENERFGERAARVADSLIVVAGVNREAITAGALRVDGAKVVTVDTLAEATERLKTLLGPGDVVLFENDLPDQYE